MQNDHISEELIEFFTMNNSQTGIIPAVHVCKTSGPFPFLGQCSWMDWKVKYDGKELVKVFHKRNDYSFYFSLENGDLDTYLGPDLITTQNQYNTQIEVQKYYRMFLGKENQDVKF